MSTVKETNSGTAGTAGLLHLPLLLFRQNGILVPLALAAPPAELACWSAIRSNPSTRQLCGAIIGEVVCVRLIIQASLNGNSRRASPGQGFFEFLLANT